MLEVKIRLIIWHALSLVYPSSNIAEFCFIALSPYDLSCNNVGGMLNTNTHMVNFYDIHCPAEACPS